MSTIRCICDECKQSVEAAFFYNARLLIKLRSIGKEVVQCHNSGDFIQLEELLDDSNYRNLKTDSRVNLFISYVDEDLRFYEELSKWIKLLISIGLVRKSWDESKLVAGEFRFTKIKRELEQAHIIILLLSPDYIISDFIRNNSVITLLNSGKKIIPIHIRVCGYQDDITLREFEAIEIRKRDQHTGNSIDLPVNEAGDQDRAWSQIYNELKKAIESI